MAAKNTAGPLKTGQILANIHQHTYICRLTAFLAQLVEQFIRNEQVAGSSPAEGSPQKPPHSLDLAVFCFPARQFCGCPSQEAHKPVAQPSGIFPGRSSPRPKNSIPAAAFATTCTSKKTAPGHSGKQPRAGLVAAGPGTRGLGFSEHTIFVLPYPGWASIRLAPVWVKG